jgi:hypothetical protein
MKRLGIEPDLIVLNPYLPGIGPMLQRRIRAKRPPKIATIGAPPKLLAASIPVHATLERPFGFEPVSRSEWLERVLSLLRELQARELDGGSITHN